MEYEMISGSTISVFMLMTIIGITAPLVLVLVWKLKTKQPLMIILTGAVTFFLSAVILESLPKLILLQPTNPVGQFVMSNAFLCAMVAGLLAGIFEETGRFVAYKFVLKKNKDRRTAIGYGIGHGGFEVMYLLTLTGVQYLAYAFIINKGEFGTIINQVASVSPEQAEALEALPAMIAATTFTTLIFSVLERIGAMLIHISCSIIVFSAVNEKGKIWLYPLAIVLHALIDIIAAAYQLGFITNVLVVELCIMIYAVVLFVFCMKKIYMKMPEQL